MTHTTHRLTNADDDFIIHLRTLAGKNDIGSGDATRRILDAVLPLGPVDFGSQTTGDALHNGVDSVLQGIRDGENFHLVFDNRDAFYAAVEAICALDTGISVIISAPWRDVEFLKKRLNLNIPAIVLDLGGLNAPDVPDWIQRLISLCGHMRISPALAYQLRDDIVAGQLTPNEAAKKLSLSCSCGCFNQTEATRILAQAAEVTHPLSADESHA